MPQDQAFRERIDRIGGLVQHLEAVADPAVKAAATELVAAVMELHETGIDRMLEIVTHSSDTSASVVESFARDPLVGSLLVLHGLHPDSMETRVRKAIEAIPGGQLISLEGGSIRLLVRDGSEAAAREALVAAAPDLVEINIEKSTSGFVPLSALATGRTEVLP